jgi:hypothetical protein
VGKKHPEIKSIEMLTKTVVIAFLNDVLQNTSARNRNNYRVDLSSLMQTLEDNEVVTLNFIKKIPVLKTVRSQRYLNF